MDKDTVTDKQDKLLNYILKSNREQANDLVDEWASTHSYRQAIFELLEPALVKFGEKWNTNEGSSLAMGYVAGKIAEDIMTKASVENPKTATHKTKGPVVIGNIEDDFHSLGRKMVVTFLRANGWEVFDLGNDVLAEEFIDKAIEVGAKVVGASAMMYTTAINIKTLRNEIDRRGLKGKIQLAVGGAVFILRPELVQEVGGDGTAKNALVASDLVKNLLEQAEKFWS